MLTPTCQVHVSYLEMSNTIHFLKSVKPFLRFSLLLHNKHNAYHPKLQDSAVQCGSIIQDS